MNADPLCVHVTSLLQEYGRAGDHPALAWRRAGLAELTGLSDGPPLVCPAPLTRFADATVAALRAMAPAAPLPPRGSTLLGERGRLSGLRRRGRSSPNGSCRLLDTADGWIALNLARPDDWSLLPALFLTAEEPTDWDAVAALTAGCTAIELNDRAANLGLAAARDGEEAPFCLVSTGGGTARFRKRPRVLDLSSLWAGPLCASLLETLGGDVVKLEHRKRPDGARGDDRFFNLLNGRKTPVSFDLNEDRDRLAAHVADADIVVEASRPRALRQFGIIAEEEVARGAVWVSITAHGRSQEHRIGYGDDCAAAGGLAACMALAWGRPLMAGDAIADPLTGLFAALAAWATWQTGEGALLDIAMSGVVAKASEGAACQLEVAEWQARMAADTAPLYAVRTPC